MTSVLEYSGIIGPDMKPKENGVKKLLKMGQRDMLKLIDDLKEHSLNHYHSNFEVLLDDIRKSPGQKTFTIGEIWQLFRDAKPIDLPIRRAWLYYDKIVCIDFLDDILRAKEAYKADVICDEVKAEIGYLGLLLPWVMDGFVELVPDPFHWANLNEVADYLATKDLLNAEWREAVLFDEDKGEYISEDKAQTYAKEVLIPDLASRGKNWINRAIRGTSRSYTSRIISSALVDCSPLALSKNNSKLLGAWFRHKRELAVRGEVLKGEKKKQLQVGMSVLTLPSTKLSFLEGISYERLRELRNSDEYRFKDFRRKWSEICATLRKMPWDEGFNKEGNVLWTREIETEVKRVQKDLSSLKKKLGASVSISLLGITTSVVPGLTILGVILSILPLITPKISIPEALSKLKEIKEDEKNETYFLVAAQ